MRTQAIEKLMLLQAEEAVKKNPDLNKLINYAAKAFILVDRSNERAASVIRELINRE